MTRHCVTSLETTRNARASSVTRERASSRDVDVARARDRDDDDDGENDEEKTIEMIDDERAAVARRSVHLSMCLSEDYPDVVELDAADAGACDDESIRAYYESAGKKVPKIVEERRRNEGNRKQAGGGRHEMEDAATRLVAKDMTERSITNSHAGGAKDYRRCVFAHGIPYRPNGLFPLNDPLLTEYSLDSTLKPFQKAIPGYAQGEFISCESWAVGDGAAAHGLDLRYFYRERVAGSEYPELFACARVGEGGAIGVNTWTLSHGGCIETILDETTAELVKCFTAPCCVTIELNAKIKKPLPLYTTVKVHVKIKSIESNGLRIWTTATIVDEKAKRGEELIASCEAQLCDAGMLTRARMS